MNLQDIQNDIDFILGSAPDYSVTDKNRNINHYYREAQELAMQASKIWRVKKNEVDTNILIWVREYTPTLTYPLLALDHIELNIDGTTDGYQRARIIGSRSMETQGNTTNLEIDGTYSNLDITLAGNTIYLPYTPAATVVDGIKIIYDPKWSELRNNTVTFTVEEAVDKTLEISEISCATDATIEVLSVVLQQNTWDTLAVTYGTGVITIKLANTTASKNTAALIQTAVRALTLTGVDFTGAICTGIGWTGITGATITTWTSAATLVVHNEPELDDNLHRYMSYGASFDYALSNDLDDKAGKYSALIEQFKNRIIKFYANRNAKGRIQLTPLKSRFN